MCYLVYTNFQRQGAVVNMTMGDAENKNEFQVVSVWGRCGGTKLQQHMDLQDAC